ncbi:CDP-glycerol glycerophosphotransferase family protein [Terrisporobacter sp.]
MLEKISKEKSCTTKYFEIYKDAIIDDNLILLEAGQGKNLNGNMFAIAREIMTNKRWHNLKVYFVVTKENLKSAQDRFKYYKFNKIKFVIRNSDEYINLLVTAKYLITDNSFPRYFVKKKEQVYLNTWHGTPLKYLGRSDIYQSVSIDNIQKNFLSADYMLFQNKFTRDVFMKDYMLENIADNKVLLCDYPRNEVLLKEELGIKLKKNLGLSNKQLIAYMPTWRGSKRTANSQEQINKIVKYLKEIDSRLKDNQIFYVNLHFLVTNFIDFSVFKNIKSFPSEYETYDFLNCCDILVTDYSSVFFDFAITKRKIILFTYDEKEYLEEKGIYLPLIDLPFQKVKTVDELIDEINSDNEINVKEFNDIYNNYLHKNITEKILDLLINKDKNDLIIEKPQKSDKKNVLIHCGD